MTGGIVGIQTDKVIQIGILTRDIKAAAEKWAKFSGVQASEIKRTRSYELTKCTYKGKRCDGQIDLVKFVFGNIEVELIQPVGDEASVWRECLDRDGEGLHHIAFEVKNMAECIKETEGMGYALLQKGETEKGRYAYMDASADMKTIIEYLEYDNR